MKKLTATFPDGHKATRRTAHPYTHVVASRLDAPRRPDGDHVKYRYGACPEGTAIEGTFRPEYDALHKGIWGEPGRRWTSAEIAANHRAWDKGFDPIHVRETAAREAHKAGCPMKCNGHGTVEISRKPEPTGWRVLSWHHSMALALKAMNTKTTAYATKGHDEVRIFPVDPEVTR